MDAISLYQKRVKDIVSTFILFTPHCCLIRHPVPQTIEKWSSNEVLARAAGKLAYGNKSGGSAYGGVDQLSPHQRLVSIAVVPRADSELAMAAALTTSGHRIYLGSDARDPVVDVRLIASQLQLAALIDAAQPAGRDDVVPGLHKTDFAAAAGGAGAGAGAVGAPKVQVSKSFCARGLQLLCAPYEGGANVFAVTREFSPAGASAAVAAFTETADLFECVEALPFGQARPRWGVVGSHCFQSQSQYGIFVTAHSTNTTFCRLEYQFLDRGSITWSPCFEKDVKNIVSAFFFSELLHYWCISLSRLSRPHTRIVCRSPIARIPCLPLPRTLICGRPLSRAACLANAPQARGGRMRRGKIIQPTKQTLQFIDCKNPIHFLATIMSEFGPSICKQFKLFMKNMSNVSSTRIFLSCFLIRHPGHPQT